MYRSMLAAAAAVFVLLSTLIGVEVAAQGNGVPQYVVEPFWPKPLPDDWILGQVAGVAVDNDDSVWIIHRPSTLVDDEKGAEKNPPETRCCKAAPPVLHFAADGTLLGSWGGPGAGYEWPSTEHGIHIDKDGNVWLAGNGKDDHQILKFTPDGKFLQQIGKAARPADPTAQTALGRPAHMVTDEAAGELYVADGYLNRRIVVFDAKTGAYKRHWGAYGSKEPSDDKLPAYAPVALSALSKSFSNPVHCVRLSRDGLVYVCDRANDRIQVFQKDGTFVKEFQVEPQTLQNGSVWDLVLSEDSAQRYIFVADGANMQISALDRQSGKRWRALAGRAAWPANSSGCTTWPSTRRATFTPPRSARAGGCRNSSAPARRPTSPSRALAGSQRASCGLGLRVEPGRACSQERRTWNRRCTPPGARGTRFLLARGPFKAPAFCAISRLGRWSCARAKLRIFACHCMSVPAWATSHQFSSCMRIRPGSSRSDAPLPSAMRPLPSGFSTAVAWISARSRRREFSTIA